MKVQVPSKAIVMLSETVDSFTAKTSTAFGKIQWKIVPTQPIPWEISLEGAVEITLDDGWKYGDGGIYYFIYTTWYFNRKREGETEKI